MQRVYLKRFLGVLALWMMVFGVGCVWPEYVGND